MSAVSSAKILVRCGLRRPQAYPAGLWRIDKTRSAQKIGAGDRRESLNSGTKLLSFETSDVQWIEVAFLWVSNWVSLVEVFQLTGPDVEAAFGPASPSPGREPLIGVFEIGGKQLTVVGCHFKSESGDDPLFGVNIPNLRITEEQRKD